MDFEKYIKSLNVYKDFVSSVTQNKLGQAYLFLCPDDVTNNILLIELAKFLQCDSHNACGVCGNCAKIIARTHPDVLIYPKSQNFMVEDATNIYDNVQIKPMLARYKVIIINNINNATEQAQNKMLKILEEPPENVVFLISATTQERVLNTILSRVQQLTVDKISNKIMQKMFENTDKNILNIALNFCDGYIGKAQEIINNEEFINNYKNMQNLLINMKNSSQIPYFSPYFCKDKKTFEINLKILNNLFRDLLMNSINMSELSNNYDNNFLLLQTEYSTKALVNILKKLNTAKQRLDSNVNLTILADNLLFDILEIKYLCK